MFGSDERLTQTILQKDTTKNTEDALIDVYKKLRPGEPPTVESSLTHLNNLFFDAKRYDLCRFGRYKYNKKLGIASRLAGHELTRPVVDEATGEILFEAGVTLSFDQAMQIQEAGVKEAFIKAETKEYFVTESGENEIRFVEKEVKVIGNGMVDINKYVSFDCEELGISEKVRYAVLREILDSAANEDELRSAIRKLGKREQNILYLRFFQGRTQTEVAKEIGISQAQVSRLEKNAILQVRSAAGVEKS